MTDTVPPPQARRDRRWRLLILGSSMLIFLVASLYGYLHGYSVAQPAWEGYYMLLVDASLPSDRLDAALQAGGMGEFVSAGTNQVLLAGASGFRTVPWKELSGRLGVPDPRFDAYVQGLGQYFSDRDHRWQIVYIPVREGLLPVMLAIGRILGPTGASWQVLEWRPVQAGLLALAGLAVGVLVAAGSRGRRTLVILCLVPWLPLCLSAGPALFALQAASLVAWALLLESLVPSLKRFSHDVPRAPFFWDRPGDAAWVGDSLRAFRPFLDRPVLRWRGLAFLLVQAGCLACAWLQGAPELAVGTAVVDFLAWPALLLLLARLYQLRHRRSEHQLFAPVPMLTTRRAFVTSLRRVLLPIALLGMLVPAAFMLFQGGSGAASIPVPGVSMGSANDYSAVRAALVAQSANGSDRSAGSLGLVRHLAYQAVLPYSQDLDWRGFALPPEGTAIGPTDWDLEASAVKSRPDTKLVLGDAWLGEMSRLVPPRSVDRLLLGQGGASGLVFAAPGKVYSADVWVIPAVVGLIVLVLPFLLAGRQPGFRQLYGSGRISTMGRKVAA